MNNLITCENGCRNPFATTEDFPNYWRLDGVGQWASRSSEYPIPASSGFTVVLSGTDVDSLLLVIFLQSSHHLPLDKRTPWLFSLIFSQDNYHLIFDICLAYLYRHLFVLPIPWPPSNRYQWFVGCWNALLPAAHQEKTPSHAHPLRIRCPRVGTDLPSWSAAVVVHTVYRLSNPQQFGNFLLTFSNGSTTL